MNVSSSPARGLSSVCRVLTVWLGLLLSVAELWPALPLENSLVIFRYNQLSSYSRQVTLFRSDGTFCDLHAFSGSLIAGSHPKELREGTYQVTDVPGDENRKDLLLIWGNREDVYRMSFRTESTGFHTGNGSLKFEVFPRLEKQDLRNVSNRVWIGPGKPAITGFIIDGDEPRWVLIRSVGETLRAFDVKAALDAPMLKLFANDSTETIGPWNGGLNDAEGMKKIFLLVGAFPLVESSSEKASLMLLQPGAYTLHSESNMDGEVLLEVYQLPFGNE